MKLIIDIPEEIYERCRKYELHCGEAEVLEGAVANSTPLNEVLDKIRDVISCNIIEDDTSGNTPTRLRADWDAANKAHMIDIAIIDRYKAESEDE